VQCEGGVNIPSAEWVRQIAELAKKLKAILIVDETQTGCGRTGKFFVLSTTASSSGS
jgi:diaminobutyrate-2-oxoglutarate transaminase